MGDLRVFPPVDDGRAVPDVLLAQYVAGECLPAEREWIEAWIAESPQRSASMRSALAAWPSSLRRYSVPATDTDHLIEHLRARIWSSVRALPSLKRSRTPWNDISVLATWGRACLAAVALSLSTAAALQITSHTFSSPAIAERQAFVGQSREFRTDKGQRAEIQLTDGSRIVLGVASSLRYTENPGNGTRVADLTGEAYFDVVPNAGKPFLVIVGNATTRVLGTRFTVRKYPQDHDVRVAVMSGRVMLADSVLDVHMIGHHTASGVRVTRPSDTERLFSWIDRRLEFHDQSLHDVLLELSRWYNFDFSYDGTTLGRERITTMFTTSASVDDVAQSLARSLGAEYRHTGRSITFFHHSGNWER